MDTPYTTATKVGTVRTGTSRISQVVTLIAVVVPPLGLVSAMGLLWGVYAVHTRDVSSFEEMVEKAKRMALRHQIAKGGDRVIIMAGIPFATAGSTNVLHVVRLVGDELERHKG